MTILIYPKSIFYFLFFFFCSSTACGFIEDILILTRNIEMNNTGPYV